MVGVRAPKGGKSRSVEVSRLPSNKIGQLRPGQGLRRIQAQQTGDWREYEAVNNFEIGDEMEAEKTSPEKPDYMIHKAGSSNH
jgi:hypothetical protein